MDVEQYGRVSSNIVMVKVMSSWVVAPPLGHEKD
jgi:hypothetical protein